MSRNRLANIIIVPYERIKAATSYLSTPLLVSIPLPLIHFDRKLRLLLVYWSTFKIGNYLPIFSFYYALLCICYCFSHLIDLFPVTWLFFLYKTTRFFYLFSASRWRKANDPAVYTNFFRFVSDLHVCLHSALRLIFYDDFLFVCFAEVYITLWSLVFKNKIPWRINKKVSTSENTTSLCK